MIQIHTGGMCHLDAEMTRQGLVSMGTEGLVLAVPENTEYGIWFKNLLTFQIRQETQGIEEF